jgi:hypothetical protein
MKVLVIECLCTTLSCYYEHVSEKVNFAAVKSHVTRGNIPLAPSKQNNKMLQPVPIPFMYSMSNDVCQSHQWGSFAAGLLASHNESWPSVYAFWLLSPMDAHVFAVLISLVNASYAYALSNNMCQSHHRNQPYFAAGLSASHNKSWPSVFFDCYRPWTPMCLLC